MRNTIIGLAAAAALIAVVALVAWYLPGKTPSQPAPPPPIATVDQMTKQAAAVKPGFIGTTEIGVWELTCVKEEAPKPTTGSIDAAGQPQAAQQIPPNTEMKLGRCRASLVVRDNSKNKPIVLVAVVRQVEGVDDLALILHTLPVSKPGAKVIIALAEKEIIGLPVASCEKAQCMALGILQSGVYHAMLAKHRLAVVIPIQATGQRMVVPLSLKGLPQSVDAMKRAG